jgi:hypothetical protein
MAKIPASYLPARGLWPDRVYTLPEHRAYPQLTTVEHILRKKLT